MSLDAVISADLVKTRVEIAALSNALAAARSEIIGLSGQISSGSSIKTIQRLRLRPSYGFEGSPTYSDATIAAINPQKTLILIRPSHIGSSAYGRFDCEIVNPTTLRCYSYGYSGGYLSLAEMDIQVVEFK